VYDIKTEDKRPVFNIYRIKVDTLETNKKEKRNKQTKKKEHEPCLLTLM